MIRAETIVGDVSGLPDHDVGPGSLGWWGTIGLMLIQGMGLVLAIGAYYFLFPHHDSDQPNQPLPSLLWGSLVAGVAIASEIPNAWTRRRARQHELRATQTGLLLITGIGVALLLLRTLELAYLDVRWDSNAQGSIIWSLLVLHTAYMAAAVVGWGLMAAQSFRTEMTDRRFSAIASSALHWHFIVWSSVALYLVIDWSPRLL